MKFDLYVRANHDDVRNSCECIMWAVLPTTCVFFLADGRFGYDSLTLIRLGLLDNDNWVKILADVNVL